MLNIFPQPLCSGDTYPLKLTFVDKTTGNPYNLTGATVGTTVKLAPGNDPDSDAVFTQTVVGDTTGIINFSIGPLNAGDYWMDVKLWRVGPPATRTTVLAPLQMHILQSVTSR
jgi:hypothetical protein